MAEKIEIKTQDGVAEAYLSRPDGESKGAVLFFIDAIGLRPRIAEMVDRIASWGYTVLAPNVFYRVGTAEETSPKGPLTDPGAREAFFASGVMDRVNGYTPDQLAADLPAFVATLDEHAGKDARIGTTGYCMGARLAVRTAGLVPERVVAVGGFHGGGLVTDEPDSPHRSIAGTTAAYVFGHADNDRSMTPENVEALEKTLTEAGVEHTNEIYPDAPHGYTMSDSSSWHEPSAQRHFAELKDLLTRTIG